MSSDDWQTLADDLLALDTQGLLAAARKHPRVQKWNTWIGDNPHPVDLIINSGQLPKPFVERLVAAIEETTHLGHLEWIARALTQKKLLAAVDPLLAAMKREQIETRLPTVYAIGNALYTIEPNDRVDEFIEIAMLSRLDYGRNRVVEHLSRYKKSAAVYDCLLQLLDDDSVRGATLEALKRFGDVRAIAAIEQTPVRDGDEFLYERHQKEAALKKLRAKAARRRS